MPTLAEIQQKYPKVTWDLRGVDPGVERTILSVFDRVVSLYPVILSELEYVGTGRRLHGEWIAVAHPANPDSISTDFTCICLNPEYYGDPAKFNRQMDLDEKNHFHPTYTGTIEASFNHELGHILAYALLTQKNVALTPFVGRDKFGLVGPTVQLWSGSHSADESLSRYALANSNEAWAEGFVAIWYHSPATPYTVSQAKLLDWLRKTEWRTAWHYAANRSEMDTLAQLAREYQIRRPEVDMYQKIRSEMADTRKELNDDKEKHGALAEKMGGDVSALFSQLHALLSQLESQLGGGVTDPALSGCRIGGGEWKEFSETGKHKA